METIHQTERRGIYQQRWGRIRNFKDVSVFSTIILLPSVAVFLCSLIPGERADLRVENHLPLLFHTHVPGIPAFKDRGRAERWWQQSQMAEERSHEQMLARCRLPPLRLRQYNGMRELVIWCWYVFRFFSCTAGRCINPILTTANWREDRFFGHWQIKTVLSCLCGSKNGVTFSNLRQLIQLAVFPLAHVDAHFVWSTASENVGRSRTLWAKHFFF